MSTRPAESIAVEHHAAPTLAYTVSEAARELRIGRTTIYRMIADKQLDTFTIRGMRRVAASEIERIIKGEPRSEA